VKTSKFQKLFDYCRQPKITVSQISRNKEFVKNFHFKTSTSQKAAILLGLVLLVSMCTVLLLIAFTTVNFERMQLSAQKLNEKPQNYTILENPNQYVSYAIAHHLVNIPLENKTVIEQLMPVPGQENFEVNGSYYRLTTYHMKLTYYGEVDSIEINRFGRLCGYTIYGAGIPFAILLASMLLKTAFYKIIGQTRKEKIQNAVKTAKARIHVCILGKHSLPKLKNRTQKVATGLLIIMALSGFMIVLFPLGYSLWLAGYLWSEPVYLLYWVSFYVLPIAAILLVTILTVKSTINRCIKKKNKDSGLTPLSH
jgi:hypothetical protein